MATIHPSRMNLVEGGASSLSHYSNADRRGDYDSRHREERGRVRDERNDGRSRRRSRSREGDVDEKGRRRSRTPDVGRNREERPRRRSPEYGSYRRDEPPHVASRNNTHDDDNDASHDPEDMYASRRRNEGGSGGWQKGPQNSYGGGGEDYFASRRLERERKVVNIWPPSPKAETLEDEKSAKKDKKSKRRKRSPSSTDDSDSEEERERRRRKEKRRKEKERDRDRDRARDGNRERERDEREHRRRKHDKYEDDDDDDDADDRSEYEREHNRERKSKHRRSRNGRPDERQEKRRDDERQKSRHSSRGGSPPRSATEDDEWVEKPTEKPTTDMVVGATDEPSVTHAFVSPPNTAHHPLSTAVAAQGIKVSNNENNNDYEDEDEDGDEIGPQPAAPQQSKKVNEREYGGALLRGEGSAMAAFLEDGTDSRIPRRGEIGLTSDEIATFEAAGYVMSGSRHRRMNAVRMRKENQVISAEEKRGILKLQREEKERREAILREEFKELVEEKLKGVQGPQLPPSPSRTE